MANAETYTPSNIAELDYFFGTKDPDGTPETVNFELTLENVERLLRIWASRGTPPNIGAYSNPLFGLIDSDGSAYLYTEDGQIRIVNDRGDLPLTAGIKVLAIDSSEPDLEIEDYLGRVFSVLSGDNDKFDPEENRGIVSNLCQPIGCYAPRTIISPGVI